MRKHAILQDCQQWDKCMCILNVCESVIPNIWTMMQGHTCMNCVCVHLTPCKRKKNLDTLASKYAMFLLKTKFAQDVASSPLRLLSSNTHLSNNWYKYREFCNNGIKPTLIKDLTISPFGYSMAKPHPHHTLITPINSMLIAFSHPHITKRSLD